MKKIAVIGANSYIARNLLYVLQQQKPDFCVSLYDYAEVQADHAKNYKQIDILNPVSVAEIDFNCDIIYMFVGKTGSVNGFDSFDEFIDINQKALLNVLNEYRKQESHAKIIFPSTRLVYKGSNFPLKEDAEKEFKTVYAINKFACEQYLEQYQNVFGIRYCVFRICVPYGTLIPNASSYGTAEFMLNRAQKGENISLYGDGSVRRTITYMGDLCRILIEGALDDRYLNDIYNIGGEDYSLAEMARLIADKYHILVEYTAYPALALKIESGSTVFDDSKLQNVCAFKYQMSFAEWCKNY